MYGWEQPKQQLFIFDFILCCFSIENYVYMYNTEPNWKGQCSAIDFPQTNVTIHQVRTIWVQRQKQLLPYGYHIMFFSNRKYGFTLRIALFLLQSWWCRLDMCTKRILFQRKHFKYLDKYTFPYKSNLCKYQHTTDTAASNLWKENPYTLILNIISNLWQTTQLRISYFLPRLFVLYPFTNSSSPVVPVAMFPLLFFYASNNKLKLIWL